MKRIILILIAIIFTTNVYAHDTRKINFDSKKECKKKKSSLNWVSKNKNTKGGELIKFQSTLVLTKELFLLELTKITQLK